MALMELEKRDWDPWQWRLISVAMHMLMRKVLHVDVEDSQIMLKSSTVLL